MIKAQKILLKMLCYFVWPSRNFFSFWVTAEVAFFSSFTFIFMLMYPTNSFECLLVSGFFLYNQRTQILPSFIVCLKCWFQLHLFAYIFMIHILSLEVTCKREGSWENSLLGFWYTKWWNSWLESGKLFLYRSMLSVSCWSGVFLFVCFMTEGWISLWWMFNGLNM